MLKTKILVQALAVAGLVATTGAAQASITVFTTVASFMAALSGGTAAVDTFAGFDVLAATPGPLLRNAGSFSYTANTVPGSNFYGAGTMADPALSTNVSSDSILLNAFTAAPGGSIGAVGANFYTSNISGSAITGDMTITAMDSSGATVSQTISGTDATGFLGFVSSTGFMTSVEASSVQPLAGFNWPTVDNLVMVAIPEPGTYALMLAGLVGLGSFVARSRRKA